MTTPNRRDCERHRYIANDAAVHCVIYERRVPVWSLRHEHLCDAAYSETLLSPESRATDIRVRTLAECDKVSR